MQASPGPCHIALWEWWLWEIVQKIDDAMAIAFIMSNKLSISDSPRSLTLLSTSMELWQTNLLARILLLTSGHCTVSCEIVRAGLWQSLYDHED